MLREISHVRQQPNDHFRRCFRGDTLELMVWYNPDKSIYGFQLCYDPEGNPRAVTWTEERGLTHSAIDDGEETPLANRSPTLQRSTDFDPARVLTSFNSVAVNLPGEEREIVQWQLEKSAADSNLSKRSAF